MWQQQLLVRSRERSYLQYDPYGRELSGVSAIQESIAGHSAQEVLPVTNEELRVSYFNVYDVRS
jgi:hypothetical protein